MEARPTRDDHMTVTGRPPWSSCALELQPRLGPGGVSAESRGGGRRAGAHLEGQAVLLLPLGDEQAQVPATVPLVAGPGSRRRRTRS